MADTKFSSEEDEDSLPLSCDILNPLKYRDDDELDVQKLRSNDVIAEQLDNDDDDTVSISDEIEQLSQQTSPSAQAAHDAAFLRETFPEADMIGSASDEADGGEMEVGLLEPTLTPAASSKVSAVTFKDPIATVESHEMMSIIPTTDSKLVVKVDWTKRQVTIGNITVPFERCRLYDVWRVGMVDSYKFDDDESKPLWTAALEIRACTTWSVTLLFKCLMHSEGILGRLCQEFLAKPVVPRSGNYLLELGERPTVGQQSVLFNKEYCLNTIVGQALPLPLKTEILKALGISFEWWKNWCCRPQMTNPHADTTPVADFAGSESLLRDEPFSLRTLYFVSVIPVAQASTIGKLSGYLLEKLTGNDYRFSSIGAGETLTTNVVAGYLNARRGRTTRPIEIYRDEHLNATYLEAPPKLECAQEKLLVETELKSLDVLSAWYLSALRGQSGGDKLAADMNPLTLIGDVRLDANSPTQCWQKHLRKFRLGQATRGASNNILGIALGKSRALMPIVERGTIHHAMVLHTNNIKLAFLYIMGLDRRLVTRLSIPAGAVVTMGISTSGLPIAILGDAAATLLDPNISCLTFAPEVDPKLNEPPSNRELLIKTDKLISVQPPTYSLGPTKCNNAAVGRRIILMRAGQNFQHMGQDQGLTSIGRLQIRATAKWLGQTFSRPQGLLGQPTSWRAVGLTTSESTVTIALEQSLELFKNEFSSHIPLSLVECVSSRDLLPQHLFSCSSEEGLDVVISDEYHILKYFGACFSIDPSKLYNMRIPHGGFIVINVNQADDAAWCPSFGMISHVPPSLVIST